MIDPNNDQNKKENKHQNLNKRRYLINNIKSIKNKICSVVCAW